MTGFPPRATVLIPAHDEAAVIARGLQPLALGAAAGEFRLVVIANGCSDDTAARAREAAPAAMVLETDQPGKANALNLGLSRAAPDRPVICLDADLVVAPADLRALLAPLDRGEAAAACGVMVPQTGRSAPLVRAFYRAWLTNPYFARGKFGGVFALAPGAVPRVFPLPPVTADDEWIRRAFAPEEIAFVPECRFLAMAPRDLGSLIRVRSRALRGARRVTALGGAAPEAGSVWRMLRASMTQPARWADLAVFAAVMGIVRLRLALQPAQGPEPWERDLSSREGALP